MERGKNAGGNDHVAAVGSALVPRSKLIQVREGCSVETYYLPHQFGPFFSEIHPQKNHCITYLPLHEPEESPIGYP